jgi:hypothetical protein
MYHGIRTVGLLMLLGLLGACGGGGGGGGAPGVAQMPLPPNASPGGIWNGTDSVSGLAVVGIVTEAGQFYFIRSDGAQFTGTVSVSGTTVSGNLLGFAPFGTTYADGSNHGTGTLSGTVAERSTLNLAIVFTTSAGTATTSNLPMTFNATYDEPSSLATMAGTFTAVDGSVVSVSGGGSVTGQNATNGCVINGMISVINPSYNAYGVSYSFASCTGLYAVQNGVTETGLGTLNTVASPVQAIIGVSATVGTQMVALVEVLDRTAGAAPPRYLTGYCTGAVSHGAPQQCGFARDTAQCPVGLPPTQPQYVIGCLPPSSTLLDLSRTCSAKNSGGQKIYGYCEVAQ